MNQFQALYLNEPPEPDPAYEYGLRYHWECETFDQRVCSLRSDRGIAIPACGELPTIGRHAKAVRERMVLEMVADGLGSEHECRRRLRDAIRHSCRQFEQEWDQRQANHK